MIRYEVVSHVGRITIDRQERRNALSWAAMEDLRVALSRAKHDPDVRVLVLTGAGDKAFCSGVELGAMAAGASWIDLHQARGALAGLFHDLWELGKPTIARVRGFALAGGFGLALACDVVVATDDAQFGAPEIDVGLWPYMITVPLCRSMPPKRALELMMTGRRVGADEGARLGFVNRVVTAGDLDATIEELTATLASKSPSIMKLGRDSFHAVWDQAADEALQFLHSMLTITTGTEDAAEGIRAFSEKRSARWTGQ